MLAVRRLSLGEVASPSRPRPTFSLSCRLARLADRLLKPLVMLPLNFRIIEEADVRTR
jgi:hypothetical protein